MEKKRLHTAYTKVVFALTLLLSFATSQADSVQQISQNLSKAALERTKHFVVYDGSYRSIDYPMGDVPKSVGVCTDVVIRSYRQLGVDLQQLVHEDMKAHFEQYPKNWGLQGPDTNIDHRRVPNLERFFERHGRALAVTDKAEDYQPGDIVSWRLDGGLPHIGIVTDQQSERTGRYMIVHNIGLGPQLEDVLFSYKVVGHYRFFPESAKRAIE